MRFFVLVMMFIASTVCAQESVISFHSGIGTYKMKMQKEFQDDYLKRSKLPLRAVHTFPPFPTFGVSVRLKLIPEIGTGVWYEYGSTGGRLHYGDYSGSASLDQTLRYSQYGFFFYKQVNRSAVWRLTASAHFSFAKTRENVSSELRIGTFSDGESVEVKSTNFGIRPQLNLERRIKRLFCQAGIGIEMQMPGVLKNDKGQNFVTSSGENVTAQWAGLRVQAGVGVLLSKIGE